MQLELFQGEKSQKKVVNVASVPQRSPFRYPGGKTWFVPTLRKWLTSTNKKPKVFLEPFVGGGIVGLTVAFESLAERIVLVELDEDVASVWQIILSKEFEKLAKRIVDFELTPKNVESVLKTTTKITTFDRAFQTIIRNRVSHGGIMAPGAGLIKNGENGKGLSSRWYPATLAKRINDIGTVRDRIHFIQGSAFDVIPDYIGDTKNAVFIDPPYTAGGKKAGRRLYVHHQLDHSRLFDIMKKSKADFLFTYDDSDELRSMAKDRGFQTALIPMKNTHHSEMEELIIGKNLKWLQKK